ncbi:hypothetical protein KJ836_02340, partial [Patescibacteria group bacterium]|nr:hypothetical protein [Patescibacteria group bacterium]
KSDWEWSWVFDVPNWQTPTPAVILSETQQSVVEESQDMELQRLLDQIGTTTDVGFNLFELPSDVPQTSANIDLAVNDKQSVLVVSNNLFNQTDWTRYKLTPQFASAVQLDADRFKFLIDKPKLKSTEAKLLIKVLLTGYPQTPLNPKQIYLSRDEYYLWEQKIAPLKTIISKLPDQSVCNFSTLWEILENKPELLKNRTIYLPQWLEFTDWALFKSVRIFTGLYLHAAVSSRRDYVHDFVDDNKIADEMFKLLNNFGPQINSLWEAISELWKATESDRTIEVNNLLATDKIGKEVVKFAEQATQTLDKFLEKVKVVPAHPVQLRQIEHTQKLIEHLQALSGKTEHKVYLEGYLDRVTAYVVKFPIVNIWQKLVPPLAEGSNHKIPPLAGGDNYQIPPLPEGRLGGEGVEGLSVIVASNSLSVIGADDFMANTFGQSIVAKFFPMSSRAEHSIVEGSQDLSTSLKMTEEDDYKKPIKIVKNLPDRKAFDYEDKVFDYLRQNLQPTEKNLVVFSNNPQTGIFFEKYYQQIPGVDIISYNVAGNSDILTDKLAQKDGFTLLVSNSNLAKYIKSVNNLDRVIFLTMPFDPPGTLGQVLATTKLRNDFTDYALPRATLKFKQALADLYDRTNEFLILDSRVVNADWASPILSSLSNFQVTEI